MLGAVNPPTFTVSEGELYQYGAMGTIIHHMAEMALKGDDNPTNLYAECKEEWALVQEGSLKLKPSAANPRGFMDKYQNEFEWDYPSRAIEVEMFDDELMLSGTADLVTNYNGKLAICDWKTCRSFSAEKKEHYFKQLALYSIMYERLYGKKIYGLCILPLNPKNKAGYGRPICSDELLKYQELALKDLETFGKLYNHNQ